MSAGPLYGTCGSSTSGNAFAALLVTSHRPLSVTQAALLEPLLAATGTAVALGHPSLGDDLERLVGPGWTVDRMAGCAAEDLASLCRE